MEPNGSPSPLLDQLLDGTRPEPSAYGDGSSQLDLARYWEALRRYAWILLALVALAMTATYFYSLRLTKVYQATATVQIDPRLPDLLGQGQEMLAAAANIGTVEYYKQQIKILSSYKLLYKTVESGKFQDQLLTDAERSRMRPDEQLALATHRLQELMTIKYPEQNRTIHVTVRNPVPRLAAELANAHVRIYEQYSRGTISTSTEQASKALSDEFRNAHTQLSAADSALLKFQRDNNLLDVSPTDRQNLVVSNISDFTRKANDARAHRITIGSTLERIRAAAKLDVLKSPILTINDVSSFDSLRAQYYTERNKLKELAKEFGPKSMELQKQQEKVSDLLESLSAENERQLAGAEEQFRAAMAAENALLAEVKHYQDEARELGPKIAQFNELVRERKKHEDSYNLVVARLSTSEMAGRMNKGMSTNVMPLDAALVPTKPVSPNIRMNVALAGFFAMIVGIGTIILVVFMDRTIKGTLDAQQSAGVPVLGVIPVLDEADFPHENDKARDLYVHAHPTSRVAECCRSLRTNIMFSAAEQRLNTVVVSSANPREGKTTSVMYLGTTMAQSGQRVLLIDTDMRRPRLHASTGVDRTNGLSTLLLGDNNYDEVIQPTEIPNLFVLPCGPVPPNPAELLMTKRFAVVLGELQKRFDRVILDSPPLGAVTDAVVLSKLVDGAILVVRAGKTEREEIRRAAKQIQGVGGRIFGVIVNELAANEKGGYYYSYYGYGPADGAKGAPAASA